MELDTPLDFAAFQLSPRHSRCELVVSINGNTEKLASGLVKPFMTHLKVLEDQIALSAQSIKLEVDRHKNVDSWFTKGTLERFVRFVSTPEIVELVITYDAEMSQLEAARRIYSQGSSDQSNSGDGRSSTTARADATKKELLRAIDVRLTAVKQDLNTACARAASAGFNQDTVSDLQLFAERFGATRLNEACCKYISLYDKRPELFTNSSKSIFRDQGIRCSYGSDMSIDDDPSPTITKTTADQSANPPLKSSSSTNFPIQPSSIGKDETVSEDEKIKKEIASGGAEEQLAQTATQPSSRRLSVQDRINLFENKQKEVVSATGSGGKPPAIAKPELRRLSSDVSNSPAAPPPAVLRRWSGASDMSIDLTGEKGTDSPKPPLNETPTEVQKSKPDLIDQMSCSSSRGEEDPITKVENISVRPEESVGSNHPSSTLEKTQSWSSLTKSDDDSLEVRLRPHTQIKSSHGCNQEDFRHSNVETSHNVADAEQFEPPPKPMTLKAPSKNNISHQRGGSGSKIQEAVAASQHRGAEIGSLRSQARSSYSAETEEVNRKNNAPTEKQFGESGLQKAKVQKNVSRDESRYVDGYSNTPPSGKFVQVAGSGSMPSEEPVAEQVHRSRQLKGNQELNDDLKMKANELEKLYAEHKLRVPVDQPNNARRAKPSEDQSVSTPVCEPKTEFSSPVKFSPIDGQNHRDALQRSFSEVKSSDDSRGKFYDSYTKKREERLREQWGGSNKAEKEARMKALHDSLERSSAEIKAKLSWSADRQDSVSTTRRRAERLRSFNARSALKREQPLDFGQIEDDEDLSEFSELKLTNNGVYKNVQSRKPLPVKNSSTATTRTPVVPVPKSGTKVASSSGRRRVQSENPLAQSVPNFLDLRKENTKPYSVASKTAARSQLRNHTRSRSTNEEPQPVKEEKAGRSQFLRKNPPNLSESSDSVILTQFSKTMEPKSFHRRNNSVGGSGIAKLKASMVMKTEEEYEPDDEEEEFEILETECQEDVVDEMELKNESLVNSESGNGQTDPSLTTELPMQDSPGESPMSWNSRIHHPFSYTHDNDANMESWNLDSTAEDVARMRKKWGSAQNNILVANSSSGLQSRRDMTKGFKRFLKFGRKSRGTDNIADWISATTSEGDDDTEDSRDVSNRSSDELRKSRMGYLHEGSFNESDFFTDQGHMSQSSIPTPPANFRLREDHLSGSSIKAPRSFFSLSSFRSKGSDSKLR
uniref:uncharacterized protein LOC122595448 n=1 Tax=Erigeron canadensis TaxID=72917 RepID=UPI001CB8912B|nr:uncharacterized protein LOC122595448 [Erigeron canadensis]XP_043623744.1 uncharacterized protein LOC122595448 [Erigeron canadensis]